MRCFDRDATNHIRTTGRLRSPIPKKSYDQVSSEAEMGG